MTIFQAFILGIVQGITEFLPISSSGHLLIFPEVFGWPVQDYDFDVAVHVATLLAVVFVMWSEIKKIILGIFKNDAFGKLGWMILAATIPVVIVGLLISQHIDAVRSVQIVAINLIVWGILLGIADRYEDKLRRVQHDIETIKWWQAMAIGCIQVFALLPGSSRSGVTISAGLFSGLDRKMAAKFSFLLAIPAIGGAAILTGFDVVENGFQTPVASIIVGFITAFVCGVAAMKFLLKLLEKSNYTGFAVYRIILGAVLLIFLV